MSIRRFDPFGDALSLRDAMNRLFEDSFVRSGLSGTLPQGAAAGLALDVEESGDAYTLRASLPGFKPEDVDVTVLGDTLTITARHQGEEERQGANYLLRERRIGSLSRSVVLPQKVQADRAEARYEHGELVLMLPKAEENRPRQIKVDVQGRQELSGGTAPRTPETGEQGQHLEGSQPQTPEMNRQAQAEATEPAAASQQEVQQ